VVGVRGVRSAEYVLCGDDLQILSGDYWRLSRNIKKWLMMRWGDSSASDFEDLSTRMRQRRDIGRLRRNPFGHLDSFSKTHKLFSANPEF
jgi:hypothetical protein